MTLKTKYLEVIYFSILLGISLITFSVANVSSICHNSNSDQLYEKDSIKCNGLGTYECGICKCNEGYSGKHCECQSVYGNLEDPLKGCRQNDDIICSGSGICICGICECNIKENSNEIYYGKYCECDNFSCPRSNNLLCSGKEHGYCECGRCACKIGWTGSACECSTSIKTCYQSPDDEICSGHGTCTCGNCQCKIPYHGEFCENCPTCPNAIN